VFDSQQGGRDFSFHIVQTGFGANPAYPMDKGGSIPPEVKRPGRKGDHSCPFSAEIKNGAIPPPHMSSWCGA
jgi:hypothetical protein